jgi:undecaprenyl-diphosphatase
VSELFTSLLLGAVQGVTEFLPVSSSGHLAILQVLAGIRSDVLLLNVLLHAGTLVAICVYYRRPIAGMLKAGAAMLGGRSPVSEQERRDAALIVPILCADAVTVIVALALYGPTEALSRRPDVIGWFLVVTAGLLVLTRFSGARRGRIGWDSALAIGIFQGIAVLPGISRSGATLFAALLFTADREEAVRFSLLAAIPVLAGAAAVDTVRGWHEIAGHLQLYLPGSVVAFLVGLASIWILERITVGRRLHWFALYLVPAGLALAFAAGSL